MVATAVQYQYIYIYLWYVLLYISYIPVHLNGGNVEKRFEIQHYKSVYRIIEIMNYKIEIIFDTPLYVRLGLPGRN